MSSYKITALHPSLPNRQTEMDEDYDQIPSSTADDELSLPKGTEN